MASSDAVKASLADAFHAMSFINSNCIITTLRVALCLRFGIHFPAYSMRFSCSTKN